MKLSINTTLYVFVSALFLVISSGSLFSDGMFMDGLFYADIARNMSEGLGSFWTPYLSETQFLEFFEHPPLALGLQGLWFSLFGDSIYVERFYSLFTVVLTGFLIVLIWKKLAGSSKHGWLPLLLWLTVTDVSWSVANNMLENTMMVFVAAAVYFLIASMEKQRWITIFLAGIALSLGLLTKGFFCLYVWGLPFFYWLFVRKGSFINMVVKTVVLILSTVLPLVILVAFSPEAGHNMITYFNKQVVGSIENVQTVSTRFAILFKFLENVIVPVGVSLVLVLVARKRKIVRLFDKEAVHLFYVMLAVTLSGVFPIMISLKQRGFYILTVYPIFAIGLAILIYPSVKSLLEKWGENQLSFKVFRGITFTMVVAALLIATLQRNRIGRDFELVSDSKVIIEEVGEGATIGLCPSLSSKWNMYGYFMRYGHVSLDSKTPETHEYLLLKADCPVLLTKESYSPVKLNTGWYQLFKRNQQPID